MNCCSHSAAAAIVKKSSRGMKLQKFALISRRRANSRTIRICSIPIPKLATSLAQSGNSESEHQAQLAPRAL